MLRTAYRLTYGSKVVYMLLPIWNCKGRLQSGLGGVLLDSPFPQVIVASEVVPNCLDQLSSGSKRAVESQVPITALDGLHVHISTHAVQWVDEESNTMMQADRCGSSSIAHLRIQLSLPLGQLLARPGRSHIHSQTSMHFIYHLVVSTGHPASCATTPWW